MPIEKKPTFTPSATFPPKNGIAYKVCSGDTWGTIAFANGVFPLNLIKFNFGLPPDRLVDPAEVKWCLRSWVGCKRTTFDKKNWIFSDDANPGLIFIPLNRGCIRCLAEPEADHSTDGNASSFGGRRGCYFRRSASK